jgi:2'-5' RNA ligase
MRIFFALDLAPGTKLEMAAWRDRSFRELAAGGMARPVPAGNFHITLAFMGDVAEQKLERLCDSVDQSLNREPVEAASLAINELGYWQRQGILWLGPRHCPDQLLQLASRLKGLGTRVGGKLDNRAFQPHITLFRRCKLPPPAPLQPPDFSLDYGDFVLLESRQGKRGVSYHPLQRWRLYS